jgi:hypothetical protein
MRKSHHETDSTRGPIRDKVRKGGCDHLLRTGERTPWRGRSDLVIMRHSQFPVSTQATFTERNHVVDAYLASFNKGLLVI